jgi:hypothetical protein
LIRDRRIKEAVGNDDRSRVERRADYVARELCACRREQECLGLRRKSHVAGMENDVTYALTESRPPGFTDIENWDATPF